MESAQRARTLELFFVDGRPDGMLKAEVFNWTGHVLMTPRTRIMDALKREQAHFTGVYLLLGEIDGEPMAYIGEADDVSTRIRNHITGNDWWTTAVIITSTPNALNKAHVRYLEARLIEEAKSIGGTGLENGTTPSIPVLSEADRANMEVFLDYVLMILPALRIDSFLRNTRPPTTEYQRGSSPIRETEFELRSPRYGLTAAARIVDSEFVILKGSLARSSWTTGRQQSHNYEKLYDELKRSGVLQPHGEGTLQFAQNYAFKSPNAAAAVINGRPSNGSTDWKIKGQNVTYKQWEANQLGASGG